MWTGTEEEEEEGNEDKDDDEDEDEEDEEEEEEKETLCVCSLDIDAAVDDGAAALDALNCVRRCIVAAYLLSALSSSRKRFRASPVPAHCTTITHPGMACLQLDQCTPLALMS